MGWVGCFDSAREQLEQLEESIQQEQWDRAVASWQGASAIVRHLFSYLACLNLTGSPQQRWQAQLQELYGRFIELQGRMEQRCLQASSFQPWLSQQEVALACCLRQSLHVARSWGRVANEGLAPLGGAYERLVEALRVELPGHGPIDLYSAQELIQSASSAQRQLWFEAYINCWSQQAAAFCRLLNRIYELRLQLGSDSQEESLRQQRLSGRSLESMWQAVAERKSSLLLLLKKRAALCGRRRLLWVDLQARLTLSGPAQLSLAKACGWALAGLSRLGSEVAESARGMIERGWVQVCTTPHPSFALPLPLNREIRVAVHYQRPAQVLDLTRQLANAWRHYALFSEGELLQHTPLLLNEAFGVFAERFCLEVSQERAGSRQLHLDLLLSHLQRVLEAVLGAELSDCFERGLLERRAAGVLSETDLSEWSYECQKQVYAEQLGSYYPYYWASHAAFYQTQEPVLRGWLSCASVLMGLGLYHLYLERPHAFCEALCLMVQQSARWSSLEELFKHYLQVDLSTAQLWQGAMELLEADVRLLGDLLELREASCSFEISRER